jgi:hypothetical protein
MTATTNQTWITPIALPDEHRIFRLNAESKYDDQLGVEIQHPATNMQRLMLEHLPLRLRTQQRGLWAIADNSANYPQDTDDGVLWLDFDRVLMGGSPAREDRRGNSPGIPLIDSQGAEQRTACDTTTLLALSVRFNWNINCLGKLVRAIEI